MSVSKRFCGRLLRVILFVSVIAGYGGLVGCEHKTVVEEGHGHHDYHDDHHDHW